MRTGSAAAIRLVFACVVGTCCCVRAVCVRSVHACVRAQERIIHAHRHAPPPHAHAHIRARVRVSVRVRSRCVSERVCMCGSFCHVRLYVSVCVNMCVRVVLCACTRSLQQNTWRSAHCTARTAAAAGECAFYTPRFSVLSPSPSPHPPSPHPRLLLIASPPRPSLPAPLTMTDTCRQAEGTSKGQHYRPFIAKGIYRAPRPAQASASTPSLRGPCGRRSSPRPSTARRSWPCRRPTRWAASHSRQRYVPVPGRVAWVTVCVCVCVCARVFARARVCICAPRVPACGRACECP